VALSAEEIRRRLGEFAATWGGYQGSERAEAQTFRERPREEVRRGELSRPVIDRRQQICVEREIGLTTLYNEVDDGAYTDLRSLHHQLDVAVAASYGWPPEVAGNPEDSDRRLLELNRQIAAGEIHHSPFSA
jgi:hypothetical protein